MIALIVSYLVIAYLLIPRVLFRRAADLGVRLKFQRTRAEEIQFAILIALFPLAAATLTAIFCSGWPSHSAVCAYRILFASSYSEEVFRRDMPGFWWSLRYTAVRQSKFLLLFYALVVAEALIFAWFAQRYGSYRKYRWYEWLASKLLLRGVNEWYMLLTSFNFPPIPAREVVADILTQEDHLYKGTVALFFTDTDGDLSGLFLAKPQRFDRVGYLRAKARSEDTAPAPFWKQIPGENLYVPRSKILSLNLSYPPVEGAVAAAAIEAAAATRELAESGIELKVELEQADEPEAKA